MFISHVRGPWISMKQGCIMILAEKSDTRRREAGDCQERIRLRRHCDQRLFHGGGGKSLYRRCVEAGKGLGDDSNDTGLERKCSKGTLGLYRIKRGIQAILSNTGGRLDVKRRARKSRPD